VSTLPISDVRFAAANAALKSRGVLGWVCLRYGDLQLDCLRVRRGEDGSYSIGFPTRTDSNGVMHPIVRPLDQAARNAIEAHVLGDLRRRRILP
jgi:hypothetical protein